MFRILSPDNFLLMIDGAPFEGKPTTNFEVSRRRNGLARMLVHNEPAWLDEVVLDMVWQSLTSYHAYAVSALAGDNNDIQWCTVYQNQFARYPAADRTYVEYINPGSPSQPLSVDVDLGAIQSDGFPLTVTVQVNLETNGSGAIVSTASEVLDAVLADTEARQYVFGTLKSGDDGTGIVAALALPLASTYYIINTLYDAFQYKDLLTILFKREGAFDARANMRAYQGQLTDFPEQLIAFTKAGAQSLPVLLEQLRSGPEVFSFPLQVYRDGAFTSETHWTTFAPSWYTRGY